MPGNTQHTALILNIGFTNANDTLPGYTPLTFWFEAATELRWKYCFDLFASEGNVTNMCERVAHVTRGSSSMRVHTLPITSLH